MYHMSNATLTFHESYRLKEISKYVYIAVGIFYDKYAVRRRRYRHATITELKLKLFPL